MLRNEFEEEIYQRYFDQQTKNLTLAPGTLAMSEYVAKDDEGNYERKEVADAWWGFCAHATVQEARINTYAAETQCPLCLYSGNWMLQFNEDGRRYELRGLLVRLGAKL